MRVKIILLFLFVVSQLTYPQERKINFVEYNLNNGLHVILHQDNSTPIVAITVTYHVGSKNEQPDRTGFAHFFEHLMFEGSEYIGRGEFDKISENAGGQNNASTSFDETFYYQILPSNQLELGLWMESERMLHLKIDSIGVETQRKVVKEERKQRLDNQPYGTLQEQVFKHAYKVHPYRWTPIGSAQYIDKATLDEFIDFYKHYYVPQNAVLSISGDINIEQAKKEIEKYFADIPRGKYEIKQPQIVEPPLNGEVRDTVYDNIQLPLVLFAYRIPAQGTPDYYALDMLNTILAQGQSSRLYKSLVDKQQKAVYAGSLNFALEDPGLFITYAVANVGVNAEDLEKAMQLELDKVKDSLISKREYQKLQNQTENDFVTSNSTNLGVARSLANYYLFFHNTNLINTEINKYMMVTREDIKRVADKYLNNDNRVVLYYLPKKANSTK
ncbi:M16 family metallopeptidase [Melioribacteraceae bacterium 4301-Me]|uniref:M16 family metallopeptidase n=1 Tax=Pyranulibacter aquaticus TaxID=3163344 RepID=UPI00359589C5